MVLKLNNLLCSNEYEGVKKKKDPAKRGKNVVAAKLQNMLQSQVIESGEPKLKESTLSCIEMLVQQEDEIKET